MSTFRGYPWISSSSVQQNPGSTLPGSPKKCSYEVLRSNKIHWKSLLWVLPLSGSGEPLDFLWVHQTPTLHHGRCLSHLLKPVLCCGATGGFPASIQNRIEALPQSSSTHGRLVESMWQRSICWGKKPITSRMVRSIMHKAPLQNFKKLTDWCHTRQTEWIFALAWNTCPLSLSSLQAKY